MKKLVENNYVNLKLLKELWKSKDDFNKNINEKIFLVPIHCHVCGITNPKHGYSCTMGMTYIEGEHQTSPYMCNKCSMDDETYEKHFGETKAGTSLIRWESYNGKIKVLKYIDHQHLSNIHYFMNLIHPKHYERNLRIIVREMLIKKYGKILPYRPDPSFVHETEFLKKLGYLKNNGDIVVHGHKIGSYE